MFHPDFHICEFHLFEVIFLRACHKHSTIKCLRFKRSANSKTEAQFLSSTEIIHFCDTSWKKRFCTPSVSLKCNCFYPCEDESQFTLMIWKIYKLILTDTKLLENQIDRSMNLNSLRSCFHGKEISSHL